MTTEEFQAKSTALMRQVSTLSLATCDGDFPWATDVYFAADGFDLFFFSAPDSRHCRNLRLNSACSATIHPETFAWQEIRGLQLVGKAEPVQVSSDRERSIEVYLEKFPFARDFLVNSNGEFKSVDKVCMYQIKPAFMTYLDNAYGFGSRFRASLENGFIASLCNLKS